jgi:hypothetical protein
VYELASIGFTGDDPHRGLCNLQGDRQKFNAGLVRAALHRRSSEAEFQCTAEFSDDRIAPCTRLKFDCEGHACGSFMDGYHVLYDKHSRYGAHSSTVRAADS